MPSLITTRLARRALLTGEGFQAEVAVQWRTPEMSVSVQVIRLATPKQANDLVLDLSGTFLVRGMTTQTIPGVDHGAVYAAQEWDGGTLETDSVGARGDVMIQVRTQQLAKPLDVTTPDQILRDQWSRL